MLRAVADQPTFWERFLPKELRRLSMELARVDALLDDPVFFAPFERFFDPRRVGRPSTPRTNPQPGRIRHHQAHRRRPKSWGSRGQLVAPQPNGPRNGPTATSCHAEARRHCERGP